MGKMQKTHAYYSSLLSIHTSVNKTFMKYIPVQKMRFFGDIMIKTNLILQQLLF